MVREAEERQRVLVVGAAEFSLGWHIARECAAVGFQVLTAGVQGEKFLYDVTDPYEGHQDLMEEVCGASGRVNHVVFTAGVNNPMGINVDWDWILRNHMAVNYEGMVKCFQAWAFIHGPVEGESLINDHVYTHFVGISSNSANIARSDSLPYCASKAAMSMAIRCLGRQYAESFDRRMVIYGYEPGWLDGTPMSEEMLLALNMSRMGKQYHRIPGNDYGINPAALAKLIATNLTIGGRMLNGTLLRVDGGEQ